MYVCICEYMYTYVCMCVYIYTHTYTHTHIYKWASQVHSDDKESACNAGDPGSIPELGSSPGEGNGNLL